MAEINNSFDSNVPLKEIKVEIEGPESGTLTENDYSETDNGDGTYTYSAAYSVNSTGDYTLTLTTAENGIGNNGATKQTNTVTVESVIPTSGLIHNWRFNTGSGSTVTDYENNSDGDIIGPSWVSGAGRDGYHLSFDGADDYVNTNTTPVSGNGNRTVAMWVKINSSGRNCFFEYGTNSTGQKWQFRTDGQSLRIEVAGGYYATSMTVPTDQWVPIACVLDGDTLGSHRLYLDYSVEDASGSLSINTATTNTAWIGYSQVHNDRPVDGKIDDVHFWDRALSKSELDEWADGTKSNY